MKKHAGTTRVWRSWLTRAALTTICAVGLSSGSAMAQTYTVTDLGTLGGGESLPGGMNASGQVTGTARITGNVNSHAFVFSGGIMKDLGTLGGSDSFGLAINAAGQVTGGSATVGNTARHAFLYSNGVMTDLGALGGRDTYGVAINSAGEVTGIVDAFYGGFLYSNGVMTDLGTLGGDTVAPWAINDAGQIAGVSYTADGNPHAFLYSNGVMTDLGTLGGAWSFAYAINTAGHITGEAAIAGTALVDHAFVYSNGVMTDLGTLGWFSRGTAINTSGQVAGTSYLADQITRHAFLYSDGVMTDLGTFGGTISDGLAINSAGQVAGTAWGPTWDDQRAFLYSDGTLIDLNTVIPSGSGWRLHAASVINDNGQMTGWGTINGEMHAFLLTPVPAMAAHVQAPIDGDGSSVFNSKRGVIPIRFTLTVNGTPTCQLPAATIRITRTAGASLAPIGESVFDGASDSGPNFRLSDCRYLYQLGASSLGPGHYRVDILIDGTPVGYAEFSLK
jgi:probable HAF family extracellular repeat protein